jgi:peroxiredoxin
VRGAREKAVAEQAADAVAAIKEKRKGPAGSREGDPAPAIEGVDLDGKKVTLADLKGKVVLISFWGSWCPPCRAEIPEHVDMREALRAKGFEVLSVNSGDSPKAARAFAEEHGIEYPIVIDDGISQKYRVSGFPTNLVVDRAGVIRDRSQGYSPAHLEEQRKLIEKLLEEK